jgi:SAM-dependent methyltransferase
VRARWVIGGAAGSVAVAAAVAGAVAGAVAARARRAEPSAEQRSGARPDPGWATCSAPGARAYEATIGRVLTGLYRAIATDLAGSLGTRSGLQIVDIGAGPGGLAVALAELLPDARITTVDIDATMADLAAARVVREGIQDRVHVSVGDVAALPLADESVDLVTSSFSVHHWPDAAAGFAEVRRVLRPGGRAVIYDLPDWWGRFETHSPGLVEVATTGGFARGSSSHLRWPGPLAVVHRIDATR